MEKTQTNPSMITYLGKTWFWLVLLGVLAIIGGAFQVITIIGIIWAWLPIWMGVLLIQAGMAAKKAKETKDKAQAELAVKKICTYFKIAGILAIVAIVLAIVSIIVVSSIGFDMNDFLQQQAQLQ